MLDAALSVSQVVANKYYERRRKVKVSEDFVFKLCVPDRVEGLVNVSCD